VYDIETQEQRAIYDRLDRDAQADFVPHGAYYPPYDWFPDSRHIAIWGKGTLQRIDTESGESSTIPFRVRSQHRITEAVRPQRDISPDRVDVRIVRQLAPSPDRKAIVFTALGSLWIRTVPAGQPHRLTKTTA